MQGCKGKSLVPQCSDSQWREILFLQTNKKNLVQWGDFYFSYIMLLKKLPYKLGIYLGALD